MLHLTLHVLNKVRHSDIRQTTKAKDIILKIKEMKWKLAGHLPRTHTTEGLRNSQNGNLQMAIEEADREEDGEMKYLHKPARQHGLE